MTQNLLRSGVTVIKMVTVVILFILFVTLATITFVAQDFLWFVNDFQEKPFLVVVYHDGQKSEWSPGQPNYDQLAEAVRQCLDAGVLRQSGVGLSAESLQDAYHKYVSVEAYFDKPVKLHAGFNTGHPTQMLFPLTGRHSDLGVVFLGEGGAYWVNAPALKTVAPLRSALISLSILSQNP